MGSFSSVKYNNRKISFNNLYNVDFKIILS